jgi:hypothetical protein
MREEINNLITFLKSHSYSNLVAEDKIVPRRYLRKRASLGYIDSYALDYTEESFRVSIIKGKEEKIVFVSPDTVMEWKE